MTLHENGTKSKRAGCSKPEGLAEIRISPLRGDRPGWAPNQERRSLPAGDDGGIQ
jgi:hypothetical protein